MRLLVWLLFGTAFMVNRSSSQGFSVIGPKVIRPSSWYTVALSNSLPQDVRLQIQVENDNHTIYQQQAVVPRKSARSVSFDVDDIPEGDYLLSAQSLDQQFEFSQRVELEYDAKTMSVFIQSDKPVYKPGDRIRFRVVVVDVDTRPVKNIRTINVGLTDAEEELVRQWPYARLNNGVFESAVQLSSESKLGNWTLTVLTKQGQTIKHVEVKEYVLPTFSVLAAPSKILLASDKEISIDVQCQYTFGEAVNGIATVDLFFDEFSKKPAFTISTSITGATTVVFKLEDEVDIDEDEEFASVVAKVKVIENFTNRTHTITQLIPVYKNPFIVTLLPSRPTFRSGVEFPVKISVKNHLNQPPSELGPIKMTVFVEGKDVKEEFQFERDLDEQGTASFMLNPPAGVDVMTFGVVYNSVEYDTDPREIRGHRSESDQHIRISLNPKYKLEVNKDIVFDVSCTEPMTHFSYIVVARGSILATSQVVVPNKKKFSLRYKLIPEMSPEARIIVFYTNRVHLIYDELVLQFDEFNNNFKFTLNEEHNHPGQNINVEVQAAKDSYIAFQAIDQSVQLVGDYTHDFTREDVLKDLSLYGSTESSHFNPFSTFGLFVRSTAIVDTPVAIDQLNRFGRSKKSAVQDTQMRTVFPESWLWVNHTMNGNNTLLRFNETIPHTITSWYVSGFALSPTLGLGVIRQPLKFEVKKSFYLVANLPSSIKRGKKLEIPVTVFNFLGEDVTTEVTLFNENEEFEFVEQSSSNNTRRTKEVAVPTNSSKSVLFMIRAKKLGGIAIKIQATTELKVDAVEHMLQVTPESHRYEKNEARVIDLDIHQTKNYEIFLDIPRTAVEGSVEIKSTLDVNLLGDLIENLEDFIRLPTGNGEDNMLVLGQNIAILDYLFETRPLAAQFKANAIKSLASGYQNQLRYQRSDGSFSVWGPKDSQGSTFLTAFVAKSLNMATKYIDVDKQVVQKAFQWLASVQQPDGQFREVGSVWNVEMQGGLRSSNYSLTSYVLIAFTENEDIFKQFKTVVTKAMNYLAISCLSTNDPYDLALASYGLLLGKHAHRLNFSDRLKEESIFNNVTAVRYWDRSSSSVKVEVAGYALLTYMVNGEFVDGIPIKRWLNQQFNNLDDVKGTQGMIVGLIAMAKLAAKISPHKNDYRLKISYKPNKIRYYDVDGTSSITDLQRDLPNYIRQARVEVTGVGHGFFQIFYRYEMSIERARQRFQLQVDVLNSTSYHEQHLKVCVAFKPWEPYQRSNMAFVEVFFPSGMFAEPDAVKDLSATLEIKKTELRFAASSVIVYYSSLGTESVCFEVTATRKHEPKRQLPAYVVVYDYYDTDRFAIKKYEGTVKQLCDVCEDEDCETLSC